MDLCSYVRAFRVLILVTIVICNCNGQILTQNEEAAFSNDKSNESSEHTKAEPAYTQPTKTSDNIQATELPDHTNEHRHIPTHKQKSKPKPKQSLNDEHKEYPSRTSEAPTHEYTRSVGRARGYYRFPTGKYRNKKRYVDFRPLNKVTNHDLQLRDNHSFGSTTNGIHMSSDKPRSIKEIIQSVVQHQQHWTKKDSKLIYPTKLLTYPADIGLSTGKKWRKHPTTKVSKFPIKGNPIHVHGGGVTYVIYKDKIQGNSPAAEGVELGGQGSGDYAGQFLPTGEPYDMQSEDEAGTTMDPTYVPNETLEQFANELSDDQDSDVPKNSNYIPPGRGSTPRHYIDDA